MNDQKRTLTKEELKQKSLLNLTESRIYLGMNRRDFTLAEQLDPTFPPRKTRTKHSRALLDEWLRTRSAAYLKKEQKFIPGPRTAKFRVAIEQLN